MPQPRALQLGCRGRDAVDTTSPLRAWPWHRWQHGAVWGDTGNPQFCVRLQIISPLMVLPLLLSFFLFVIEVGVGVIHQSTPPCLLKPVFWAIPGFSRNIIPHPYRSDSSYLMDCLLHGLQPSTSVAHSSS